MKLIHPKKMTEKQAEAYQLCFASSRLAIDRDEAVAAIMNGISLIESGATVIDAGLPVPAVGKIDLLADDGKGRLVAICFENELCAQGLSASIMRGEWVAANRELLEHIYGRMLPPAGVRTWIFAAAVLPEAAVMLRLMERHLVGAYIYEGMGLGEERWLVVRSALENRATSRPQRAQPPAQAADAALADKKPIQLRSVLSTEEVNDFFGIAAEEEITNSGAMRE
ncbi:MAG: hypothetical protein WC956_04430 [bacterium]